MSAKTFLFAVSFAVLACAAPRAPYYRRQTNSSDSLGSLAGTTGVNQTFDYVIVGAGTAGMAAHEPFVASTS